MTADDRPDTLTIATAVGAAQEAQRYARIALWHWFRSMSEAWYCAGWDPYTLTRARQLYTEGHMPAWVIGALNWCGWPADDLTWDGEYAECEHE